MGASIVRTITSYLVGWLVSFTIVQEVGLTTDQLTWLVLALVTGASTMIGSLWYLVFRRLEKRWPWLGWFLGKPGAPIYPPVQLGWVAQEGAEK